MPSINHHVTGQQYWRSLEQLAETPAVADFLSQEFPGYDPETIGSTTRRGFMKIMGAAMALAGITLTGCRRWPVEELAPFAGNPRGVIPGVPEQYATSWELGGVGASLLVTSYDGRPIKIEGNPDHPASQTATGRIAHGSADAFAQASLLEMYDPQRSRQVIKRTQGPPATSQHTTWEDFVSSAKPVFAELKDGAGLAILSEATCSPSVKARRAALLEKFPRATWYEYEPLSGDNEREGAKLAFGKPHRTVLHLDKANVVVSLDADLLGTHPNHTRYANDWSKKRRSADSDKTMSRVYVAESGLSITGSVADVRIGVDPSRIDVLARAIATAVGVAIDQNKIWPRATPPSHGFIMPTSPPLQSAKVTVPIVGNETLTPDEANFVKSAIKDLQEAKGLGVVAVGPSAAPEVYALGHAINAALQAVGKTIDYVEDDSDRPTHLAAIAALTAAINKKEVTTLLMLGGNPVYDAPVDIKFAVALAAVPTSIHLSHYDNETSRVAKWHLPRAHYLECWGDVLTWDGTWTLQQPLIQPLFGGKSVIEVLAVILGTVVPGAITSGDQIVRQTYHQRDLNPAASTAAGDSLTLENKFRKDLERGFLLNTAAKFVNPSVAFDASKLPAAAPAPTDPKLFTLRFEADSRVYDGRFANNGWLQETPDPLTKLMWDNALLISVKDGKALDVDNGDKVEISLPGGAKLTVPICLLPGQPLGVVSLSLGYGRTAAGHIGDGLGFNSYSIRTSAAPWSVPGVQLRKTGEDYLLVTSAEHHMLSPLAQEAEEYSVGEKGQNGKIIREATLEEYRKDPEDLGGKVRKFSLQLFQEPATDAAGNKGYRDIHAWGMTIDLAACIGCNACALACQAENNIPIVGKDQCYRHREMNWIRIDRYFKGDVDDPNPEVVFQPMACHHCENAPCEQVCPVAATTHDSEGLNVMVYNRCVGTRYCSNNCPYKVRRFNYFDFHAEDPRFGNAWIKAPWLNLPDLQQLDPKLIDPIKRMVFNPEVTVRMRGVMEKCTYCIQRIHRTVTAKRTEGRDKDIVDGDIITACQQACPTQAIVFGNLNDPTSQVSKLQKSARAYDVLHEELNTRPRTRYLSKLRNPV